MAIKCIMFVSYTCKISIIDSDNAKNIALKIYEYEFSK